MDLGVDIILKRFQTCVTKIEKWMFDEKSNETRPSNVMKWF